VIIAPSFADIFFNNCFKNGLLPIVLEEKVVDDLFEHATADQALNLSVDLQKQQLTYADKVVDFDVDPFRKHCLIEGLDDIGLTLQHVEDIRAYEEKRKQSEPWIFA
jgi:3-isopropylmalate/(R)-2-methylmalate dehydratase small subunit